MAARSLEGESTYPISSPENHIAFVDTSDELIWRPGILLNKGWKIDSPKQSIQNLLTDMGVLKSLGWNGCDRPPRWKVIPNAAEHVAKLFWINFEYLHLDTVKFVVYILKFFHLENLQVNLDSAYCLDLESDA